MHLPEKDNVTKVSVVIPTLNEAHSIGATLDAISQLSRRVEVIVVDGGSDDDTREIARAHGDAEVAAGNLRVRFDGPRLAARFLTWLYPRLRWLGLYYGDSAIFVRREAYERVGGFKPFPIFDDLDLMERLRDQGRVVHLPVVVVTSSRRFEGC